jgi:NAD(P)H dehydrogenase (quinone)
MIIVTGATGQLGHAIVTKLVDLVPADDVGVSVRNIDRAADLQELGVRVRQGDFDDAASLQNAFEGATQVLLVSSNARSYGGDPLAQHATAISAAKAVGARRIVYTSHMAASTTSLFPPQRDHIATEQMLQDSGVAWTALRNGFYMASGIAMMGNAAETGVLEAPADGKFNWAAHADLAGAAAIILASEGRYDGPTPPLVGSEALDFADLAAIVSEVNGRPIERRFIADDQLRTNMTSRGTPDHVAAMVVGLYAASRNGEFLSTDPTLTQLLGRPTTTVRELLTNKLKLNG